MTWHGMACTIGSPYGGAHGGDVTHEGNRGAVPPLCAATSRAKTVLNTGAPSQVCRETEGERLHDPDVWMIVASFVQPPRQGRGPASGGEGTAERMCGVWGDATVACCRAVVRRLCGLCRGVRPLPVCFQSAGRDSRRLRPRSQAPSSKDEARSASAVWNGSLHFDRALWSLHGPLAGRCTPGVHRERSRRSAKSWVAPGTFRLRRVVALY